MRTTVTSQMKLIDYGTLRGRAGYAFGQFLPYAFFGGAVGRFNYSTSTTVRPRRGAFHFGP